MPAIGTVSSGAAMPTSGGTTITLTGTNFHPVNRSSSVRAVYGGVYDVICTVVEPAVRIMCTSVPGVGAQLKWVVVVGGQASVPSMGAVSYARPSVVTVTGANALPTTGGTTFYVTGLNFGPRRQSCYAVFHDTARFANMSCILSVDHVQMECISIEGGGRHSLIVVVGGQRSDVAMGGIAVYKNPSVDSVNAGLLTTSGGDVFFVIGSNFGPVGIRESDVLLTYGGSDGSSFTATACVVVVGHVNITCKAGEGIGVALRIKLVVLNIASVLSKDGVVLSYADPSITSIDPFCGPVFGGFVVSLKGTNFGRQNGTSMLGATKCVVLSWTHLHVTCIASRVESFGAVAPSIGSSADRWSPQHNLLMYYYEITSMRPGFGPNVGGTSITVGGRGFVVGVLATVRSTLVGGTMFGYAISDTAASFISNQALCASCNISYEISLNRNDFSEIPGRFQLYALPDISSIDPFFGPDSGGTTVTASFLHPLFLTPAVTAKFSTSSSDEGSVTVSCVRLGHDGYQVVCISPPLVGMRGPHSADPMLVNVSVSIDDPAFHKNPVFGRAPHHFFAYADPVVLYADPPLAPVSGGTLIRFIGRGFVAPPRDPLEFLAGPAIVDFGGIYVSATVINSTLLECVSPKTFSRNVSVSVLLNRQQPVRVSAEGSRFLFYEHQVFAVSPCIAPVTIIGHRPYTMLTLTVSNFSKSELDGGFANVSRVPYIVVRATQGSVTSVGGCSFVSATIASCEAPTMALVPGNASVCVSVNGVDFSPHCVTVLYYAIPRLDTFAPIFGPITGATSVLLRGSWFPTKFARAIWKAEGNPVHSSTVACDMRDDANIVCQTPALSGSALNTTLWVSVDLPTSLNPFFVKLGGANSGWFYFHVAKLRTICASPVSQDAYADVNAEVIVDADSLDRGVRASRVLAGLMHPVMKAGMALRSVSYPTGFPTTCRGDVVALDLTWTASYEAASTYTVPIHLDGEVLNKLLCPDVVASHAACYDAQAPARFPNVCTGRGCLMTKAVRAACPASCGDVESRLRVWQAEGDGAWREARVWIDTGGIVGPCGVRVTLWAELKFVEAGSGARLYLSMRSPMELASFMLTQNSTVIGTTLTPANDLFDVYDSGAPVTKAVMQASGWIMSDCQCDVAEDDGQGCCALLSGNTLVLANLITTKGRVSRMTYLEPAVAATRRMGPGRVVHMTLSYASTSMGIFYVMLSNHDRVLYVPGISLPGVVLVSLYCMNLQCAVSITTPSAVINGTCTLSYATVASGLLHLKIFAGANFLSAWIGHPECSTVISTDVAPAVLESYRLFLGCDPHPSVGVDLLVGGQIPLFSSILVAHAHVPTSPVVSYRSTTFWRLSSRIQRDVRDPASPLFPSVRPVSLLLDSDSKIDDATLLKALNRTSATAATFIPSQFVDLGVSLTRSFPPVFSCVNRVVMNTSAERLNFRVVGVNLWSADGLSMRVSVDGDVVATVGCALSSTSTAADALVTGVCTLVNGGVLSPGKTGFVRVEISASPTSGVWQQSICESCVFDATRSALCSAMCPSWQDVSRGRVLVVGDRVALVPSRCV